MPTNKDFISVTEFAKRHDLSERTVRNWGAAGKIDEAFPTGKTWSLPVDAQLPTRKGGQKETLSPFSKDSEKRKRGE